MIKTVAYNDFSDLPIETTSNKDLLMKELVDFHNQGGNLNLNIYKYQHTPAEEWLRGKFEDPAYMIELFEKGVLHSPNKWILDTENKTIIAPLFYNSYWFRDNHKFYTDYLAKGVENLMEDIKIAGIDVSNFSYTYNYYENDVKSSNLEHPLLTLTVYKEMINFKILDTILNHSPEYAYLWKQPNKYNEEKLPIYQTLLGARLFDMRDKNLAIVLYKHNIAKDFLLKNNVAMKNVVWQAVCNDDIDFVKKHIHEWNLPVLEQSDNYNNSFLKMAQSTEMANLLLDNNCYVEVTEIGKECNIFGSEHFLNLIAIEAILDHSKYQHLLSEKPEYFAHYFKELNAYQESKTEIILSLIHKYHYNTEKVDLLYVGKELFSTIHQDGVVWALEHGADPRNCQEFIKKWVSKENFSELKAIHTKKILNLHYPDPLSEIIKHKLATPALNLIDKASVEDFNRETKYKKIVWWKVENATNLSFISKKIPDFNILNSLGQSYLYYKSTTSYIDSNLFNTIIKEYNNRENNKPLSIEGYDKNNNNIFHNLFNIDSKLHSVQILDYILNKYSEEIIFDLLKEENKNGKNPIELLVDKVLDSINSGINSVYSPYLYKCFNIVQDNFDYSRPYEDKTITDILPKVILQDNILENIKEWAMASKLNKILPNKSDIKIKNKI